MAPSAMMAICLEKGYSASELEITFGMPAFKIKDMVDSDPSVASSAGASIFLTHGMSAHSV